MWILDDLSDAARRFAEKPAVKKGAEITGKVLKKGLDITGKALSASVRYMSEQCAKMPQKLAEQSQNLGRDADSTERQLESARRRYERDPSYENYEEVNRLEERLDMLNRNQQRCQEAMMRFSQNNNDDYYDDY